LVIDTKLVIFSRWDQKELLSGEFIANKILHYTFFLLANLIEEKQTWPTNFLQPHFKHKSTEKKKGLIDLK
jgi:hypothetical protein